MRRCNLKSKATEQMHRRYSTSPPNFHRFLLCHVTPVYRYTLHSLPTFLTARAPPLQYTCRCLCATSFQTYLKIDVCTTSARRLHDVWSHRSRDTGVGRNPSPRNGHASPRLILDALSPCCVTVMARQAITDLAPRINLRLVALSVSSDALFLSFAQRVSLILLSLPLPFFCSSWASVPSTHTLGTTHFQSICNPFTCKIHLNQNLICLVFCTYFYNTIVPQLRKCSSVDCCP